MADTTPRTPAAKKAGGTKKAAATAGPRRPGAPSKDDKLREALTQTYVGIGAAAGPVMGLFGMSEDQCNAASAMIAMSAEQCAEAWVQLAGTNPQVRKTLEKMTEAGGWGTVVFAHVALGMGIAAAVKATAPEPAPIEDQAEPIAAVRVAPEDVDQL